MRAIIWTLLAIGLFGVLHAAAPPVKEGGKGSDGKKLWAALSVSRPILDHDVIGERPFMIFFGLVNDGDQPIDPDLDASQLLINGKNLKNWTLIIHNGPKDGRWKALPPGGHLSFGIAMGNHFQDPGIHRMVWKGRGFQSPEIEFRIMPRKAN